jgi:hypothetical protein
MPSMSRSGSGAIASPLEPCLSSRLIALATTPKVTLMRCVEAK